MTYDELHQVISNMTPDQRQGDIVVTDLEGAVYAVYGTAPFEDCGERFTALHAAIGTGDDNIHPLYMKGTVHQALPDKDVMAVDAETLKFARAHQMANDDAFAAVDELHAATGNSMIDCAKRLNTGEWQ